MRHVVLLGDSIFDNGAYVAGGPDVPAQLREALGVGGEVTLLARDGSVTRDVHTQLERVPQGASHLVLSVGGNDALGHLGMVDEAAGSVAEVLDRLARMARDFDLAYRQLLVQLLRKEIPLVLCTIYEGALGDPALQRRAATGLCQYNDVILRAAIEHRLALVDLRLACDSPRHYVNAIEPSVAGGARIAAAVARAITQPHEVACAVYA